MDLSPNKQQIEGTLLKLYNHPLLYKVEKTKVNDLKRKVTILSYKLENEKNIVEELKTDHRNEVYKLVVSINELLDEVKELIICEEEKLSKEELEEIKENITKCAICQLKFMKGDVIAYCDETKKHSHLFHYYCLKNSIDLTTVSLKDNRLEKSVNCPYCCEKIEYKYKSQHSNPWFIK